MNPRFEKSGPKTDADVKVDVDTGEEVESEPETKATKSELESPDQSEVVMALMSDPDIQSVINARRAGKKTRVVVDEELDEPDEPADLDLDTDDPEITGAVKQIMGMLDKKLTPMMSRLDTLDALAEGLQKTQIDQEIVDLSKKYKDFPKHRAAMVELSKTTSGVGLEQLYLLAKYNSGDVLLESPSTESERSTPTARPTGVGGAKKDRVRGRAAWNDRMTAALEKAIP